MLSSNVCFRERGVLSETYAANIRFWRPREIKSRRPRMPSPRYSVPPTGRVVFHFIGRRVLLNPPIPERWRLISAAAADGFSSAGRPGSFRPCWSRRLVSAFSCRVHLAQTSQRNSVLWVHVTRMTGRRSLLSAAGVWLNP